MGHDLHSELDVTEFDAARFAQAERRLQEQGIEIASYHELVARDPDFLRKFFDLTSVTMQDVPHSSQPFISKYNLNDDNNILGNNKFLHDNVD
jgi:hypothetical protein